MPDQICQETPVRTDAAQRILTAARQLFTERGFDGVSIRDIAGRAGVSKANVFHHFTNKASLYDAVLEDSRLTFDELLTDLADGERPFADRLERFARDHLRNMIDDPSSVNLFMRQMLNPPGNPQRARAEETIGDGMLRVLKMLEADIDEDGDRTRGVALAVAVAVLGGTFMHFQLREVLHRLEVGADGSDPDRFCQLLITLLRPVSDSKDGPEL